jgi:hypothetical protein
MTVVAATSPYPWPHDGRLAGARLAVVVTGHDAGWISRSRGTVAVRDVLERLVAAVDDVGGLVVRVAHDGQVPDGAAEHLTAAGVDGFYGSSLDLVLRSAGRDQLLMSGYGLETTVHSTMRSANDRGYECLLVADACAHLDADLESAALRTIEMSGGIFGAVGSSGPVLEALDQIAAEQEHEG